MLNLYKSNRVENLLEGLVRVLHEPPPSPAAPEWIGIPTQGVRMWLEMKISNRLGIWANVYSPFPRALIEEIFTLVVGNEETDFSFFQRDRLFWGILSLLPDFIDLPEFSSLKNYLIDDGEGIKRFQLARRIADVFDQYAVYRYDMIGRWEKVSEKNRKITAEDRWQPILWNALVERFGPGHIAAAAGNFLNTPALEKIDVSKLPHRISLFGISTLPPLYLHVLSGLAEIIPVHLFLLSPSREFWADTRPKRDIIRASDPSHTKRDQGLYLEEGNALLSSLGALGRDFQCTIEAAVDYGEPLGDMYTDSVDLETPTLLTMLQSDILNLRLRQPEAEPPLAIDPSDTSVAVHACHSPMREVQVLHDQLTDMFENDLSLEPHDVIVMVPDIHVYAPLITSVFGAGENHHKNTIPFGISDRCIQEEAEVIRAFIAVLAIAKSRMTAQDILDLLSMDPVRNRFGISADDINKVKDWIFASGVRWGVDASHRRAVGQPEFNENTWRFGLDRLLLGYALPQADDSPFFNTVPFDKIEGKETEILGRVVEFCETLFGLLPFLGQPHEIADWKTHLQGMLNLMIACDGENEYQHQLIRHALQDLVKQSEAAGFSGQIGLDVMRRILAGPLEKTTSTRGFLSGGVTFCNFLAMRSIPFKIVCLMGIDDAVFPRSEPAISFNLMTRHPRSGDRSMRNDDRYLFLEALMSARSRLLITYVGRSIHTNSVIPASVVVSELLHVICDGFYLASGSRDTGFKASGENMVRHLVTTHSLQPFSSQYFDGTEPALFSYSKPAYEEAMALYGTRQADSPFVSKPLPKNDDDISIVSIEDLIRFFRNPAAYFLQEKLGLFLDDPIEDADPREPMTLNGLTRYALGERLLNHAMEGRSLKKLYPVIRLSGVLPLGAPGRSLFDDIVDIVEPICSAASASIMGDPLFPIRVDRMIGKTRIIGTIGNLWPDKRVVYTYGKLTPNRRVALWIHHLILNLLSDDLAPGTSVMIGRGDKGPEKYGFFPVNDTAEEILTHLLALYWQGRETLLPFFQRSSHAFAQAWLKADATDESGRLEKAINAARRMWEPGKKGYPGEQEDPYIHRLFGQTDPIGGSFSHLPGHFQDLAPAVFTPMIQSEIDSDNSE